MFDRQLAKWHLEKLGYLAAMDVNLSDQGTVDVFGVRDEVAGKHAVFGVVRGWWHAGAYLTPGLLRNHLQTERRLLDRPFAPERLERTMVQFGLRDVPEKVLFYSKRSPSVSEQAEQELQLLGIRVVYLEDILAKALAEANYDDRAVGSVFSLLAMVKSSRIFKEMARLARRAERDTKPAREDKPAPHTEPDSQLDLLLSFADEDEPNEMDSR